MNIHEGPVGRMRLPPPPNGNAAWEALRVLSIRGTATPAQLCPPASDPGPSQPAPLPADLRKLRSSDASAGSARLMVRESGCAGLWHQGLFK